MNTDKEIEIVHQLAERILGFEDLLTATSDICGELDSIMALAQGARLYKLCRPRMTEANVIDIKGGRHLLQELTVPSFIANDTLLHGANEADDESGNATLQEGPSMVILTGPNYSGKSVYLKQVALITLMAHAGSFVPAESATIGMTDKILTRISTRESVSRAQSAFMIDLQQMSMALNLATRRSLLVIDEIGKGTESYDGAGLAAGFFEHLLDRGMNCPKVLGATHFYEIFESGFLLPRDSLDFAHMEVRLDTEAIEADKQITYLYKCVARVQTVTEHLLTMSSYRPGRSTSSFGTWYASMSSM